MGNYRENNNIALACIVISRYYTCDNREYQDYFSQRGGVDRVVKMIEINLHENEIIKNILDAFFDMIVYNAPKKMSKEKVKKVNKAVKNCLSRTNIDRLLTIIKKSEIFKEDTKNQCQKIMDILYNNNT